VNPTDPIAVFRTAGAALVIVHPDGNGFRADCCGCKWATTSQEAARGAGGIIGRPTEPLALLKDDANTHALGCAEVPHEQWPGANTDGW
jgi:hypothetical protein